MSRPKGKGLQRRLVETAKEMLEPFGCQVEVDFSARGGHQKLRIIPPRSSSRYALDIPSSPKGGEESAQRLLVAQCKRLMREFVTQ